MQRKLGIIGIILGCFIVAFDFAMVNSILSTIQYSFKASFSQMQWVMTIFALFMSVFMVAMSRLSNYTGKKIMMQAGFIIFAFSSLIAGMATCTHSLIIARGFQGFAAALLMPASLVLINSLFAKDKQSSALTLWIFGIGLGATFGVICGGYITAWLTWHWAFYLDVFVAVLGLSLLTLFVQKPVKQAKSGMDWLGLMCLALGISAFVIACIESINWGFGIETFSFIGLFILLSLLFIYIERKVATPIIDLKLFTQAKFSVAAFTSFTLLFFTWTIYFLAPQYFHIVLHYSLISTGWIMILISLPALLVSLQMSYLTKKINPKWLVLSGLVLIVGSAVMQLNFCLTSTVLFVMLALALFGLGWGFILRPAFVSALSFFPHQKSDSPSDSALGSLVTITQLGGCIGLALATTIFQWTHTFSLQKNLALQQLPLTATQIKTISGLLIHPSKAISYIQSLGIVNSTAIHTLFESIFVHGYRASILLLVILGMMALLFALLKIKPLFISKSHKDS